MSGEITTRNVYESAYRNYRKWSSGQTTSELEFQVKRDALEGLDYYAAEKARITWQESHVRFTGKPGHDYGSYKPRYFRGLAALQSDERWIAQS